jgi:hypothetical protein
MLGVVSVGAIGRLGLMTKALTITQRGFHWYAAGYRVPFDGARERESLAVGVAVTVAVRC